MWPPALPASRGRVAWRVVQVSIHCDMRCRVIVFPIEPHSANQSAISFPRTFVCERTCSIRTCPGRCRCRPIHAARSWRTMSLLRLHFGSHRPVVMFIAYSESVCNTSFPSSALRCARHIISYSAVNSPVLLVWACAPIYDHSAGSICTMPHAHAVTSALP